jgi:hypothetical protein
MAITKYSFEILKNFPSERRYLIKMPLKKSLLDSFAELFGGKK